MQRKPLFITLRNITIESIFEVKDDEKNIHEVISIPKIFYNYDLWPKHTNRHCYYCHHKIDNVPIPLLGSDNTLKKFLVLQVFDSFNCILRYLHVYKKLHPESYNSVYLNMLEFIDMSNADVDIHNMAPEIDELEIFGGMLAEDEFRRDFTYLFR